MKTTTKGETMTRIILLLALVLGLAAGAGAAQKYLDLDAGSNGNGAIATPWNTWSTPKGSLSHGDTLWCRGNYLYKDFYWDASGKKAYLASWSIKSGSANDSMYLKDTVGGGSDQGMIIQDSCRIKGFIFTSRLDAPRIQTDYLITIQKRGVCIDSCKFHDFLGTPIWTYSNSNGDTIKNCVMYNSYGGHGIQISSDSCRIYNCKIWNMGYSGIFATAQNDCIALTGSLKQITVSGCDLASNSAKSDILCVGNTLLKNVTITNNYCHGANTVAGIDIDASNGVTYHIEGLNVYNNIFAGSRNNLYSTDPSYGCIRFNQCNSDDPANPISIYNNTIYDVGHDTSSMFHAGIVMGTSLLGYINIKNNIAYTCDSSAKNIVYPIYMNSATPDTAHVVSSNNLFFSTEGRIRNNTTFKYGANDDTSHSPAFISSTNLGVYTSSPAYNTGADLSALFTTAILDSPTAATWPNPATVTRATWSKGAMYPYAPNYDTCWAIAGANGSVSPASQGDSSSNVNHALTFVATPATHYAPFWTARHGATISNAFVNSITATISQNDTLDVAFHDSRKTLTMAGVNGSVTPATGLVDSGASTAIDNTPNMGYRFSAWSGAGVTFGNANLKSTTATILINATATATDTIIHYQLTNANDGHGTFTPASGLHDTAASFSIVATAAQGYRFWKWNRSGLDVVITDSTLASTTALLKAPGTITLYDSTMKVVLTVVNASTAPGTISPTAGPHTLDSGATQAIIFTAPSGYAFWKWGRSSLTMVITDSSLASTSLYLKASGTLTAYDTLSGNGGLVGNPFGFNIGSWYLMNRKTH